MNLKRPFQIPFKRCAENCTIILGPNKNIYLISKRKENCQHEHIALKLIEIDYLFLGESFNTVTGQFARKNKIEKNLT